MKNKFKELKRAVKKLNDPTAVAIVDLLEDYNRGLSCYFRNRKIDREFLNVFDIPLTIKAVDKKFNVDSKSSLIFQQVVIDLNTLARSTWYFEKEDGTILTGEDLYRLKAVYMASYKTLEPVYASKEDKQKAEELWDYVESVAFWGDINSIPKPIGYEEVIKELAGEEKTSTVTEMLNLIRFHSISIKMTEGAL